ncbi:uncharacterized protein LOC116308955 [Actinia tenebrosa]|uniref:Uncharacterized protein LOC116308955 n=1 Tax=Actinia tenebrosa TaxID=6105 RepID=A0A6P8J6F0_ACTTE|nr:uncharacterized protein LOC116308955 [Actinia tenebrosa]
MEFLVLILLLVLLYKVDHITSTNTHDDRNPGLLFDNHPGYLLSLPANMTKVKQITTKVSSKMDCVFACVRTSWCRSVNFKITAEMDGRHICELIATDNYTNTKYLKQDEKFTHLNIKNPCADEPCLNQGICIPHSNGFDYRCKCKEGYHIGNNCQKVTYLLGSPAETCTSACASRGMSCIEVGAFPNNALSIFHSINVNCKTPEDTNWYLYKDQPNYVVASHWSERCTGFKGLNEFEHSTHCGIGGNPIVQRLCPCKEQL